MKIKEFPNKEFNCVMVVVTTPSETLQFQYFRDFNKWLRAIFSQLSFENFWPYLWVRLFWLKMIKNSYKSPLKVFELKVWVKQPPDVFQNVKTFGKGSLISMSSEPSKIHLLIKVLCRPIWCNLCRQYSLFHDLNVSLRY